MTLIPLQAMKYADTALRILESERAAQTHVTELLLIAAEHRAQGRTRRAAVEEDKARALASAWGE